MFRAGRGPVDAIFGEQGIPLLPALLIQQARLLVQELFHGARVRRRPCGGPFPRAHGDSSLCSM